MTQYGIYILVLISIYAMLALSLDLLVGYLGLISLAHAAFFGIGAYATAIALHSYGVSPLMAVGLSAITAAISSFAVSLPSLRLRGDYFVIAAFAFQMLIFSLFNNLVNLTGGPQGISLAGAAEDFAPPALSPLGFGSILVGLVAITLAISWKVGTSQYGRLLRAVREDEILAATLGKNTTYLKVSAFALSASIAGATGAIYALYIRYMDPTSFSVFESVLMLAMVLLWRPVTIWGPVLGAASLVLIPELLRLTNVTTAASANIRQIVFGAALIATIFIRGRVVFGSQSVGDSNG